MGTNSGYDELAMRGNFSWIEDRHTNTMTTYEKITAPWADRNLLEIHDLFPDVQDAWGLPDLEPGHAYVGMGVEKGFRCGGLALCVESNARAWIGSAGGISRTHHYSLPCDLAFSRHDPPRSEWPLAAGCGTVRRGWGWKGETPAGYAVFISKTKDWTSIRSRVETEGIPTSFYVEFVPAAPKLVPFDGPEDFACNPAWVRWQSRHPRPPAWVGDLSIGVNLYQGSGPDARTWEQLFADPSFEYADHPCGPWRKFAKEVKP